MLRAAGCTLDARSVATICSCIRRMRRTTTIRRSVIGSRSAGARQRSKAKAVGALNHMDPATHGAGRARGRAMLGGAGSGRLSGLSAGAGDPPGAEPAMFHWARYARPQTYPATCVRAAAAAGALPAASDGTAPGGAAGALVDCPKAALRREEDRRVSIPPLLFSPRWRAAPAPFSG